MNQTLVRGVAAIALMLGATLSMTQTADAGFGGGGLFAKMKGHKCGGGLFAHFKAKHASPCATPEPACCEPAPEPCCAPAPVAEPCCAPAPVAEPCCAPAPVAEPCCGEAVSVMEAAPVMESSCCGGEVMMEGAVMGEPMMESTEGYNLAPGEVLVPGSVETVSEDTMMESKPAAETMESPSDAVDAVEEATPPAPQVDSATDA